MANKGYDERYCAFIDILGFSRLVSGLRNDPAGFVDVQRILQKIHEPVRIEVSKRAAEQADFQAQSISDAVAISTRCTTVGLLSIFLATERLVRSLLGEGYFTRGAVCKGLLFHDDKTVFGEALIKAYQLESQTVKFPRIMLTKDVVEDAAKLGDPRFSAHILQAEDGPFFLHVLRPLQDRLEKLQKEPPGLQGEIGPDLKIYEEMRARIVQRFEESVDTPSHYEKIQWFARYWNNSIIDIRPSVGRIKGPGLTP